jgi:hypothetical protein
VAAPAARPVISNNEPLVPEITALATEVLLLVAKYGAVPPPIEKVFAMPTATVTALGAVENNAPGKGTDTDSTRV